MATTRRRKKPAVIDLLLATPEKFEFFQAVRILERLAAYELGEDVGVACEMIGQGLPAALEAVSFSIDTRLRFPEQDIVRLESITTTFNQRERAQFLLTVTLMRLTGSTGVLPWHYSELILRRARLRDLALKRFLDIFNHRAISLFYRAASKYRFALRYEHQHLLHHREQFAEFTPGMKTFPTPDLFTETLRSLTGINCGATLARLTHLNDHLLRFAAYFMQGARSAGNLERMLSAYFELPVQVDCYQPQWQTIVEDMLTRLPSRRQRLGQNAQLGVNALLGSRVWSAQGKFRILIAPIHYQQYQTLAPGSAKSQAMRQLIRLYAGSDLDYDIELRIPARELPRARLQKAAALPLQLGWNGYLPSRDDHERLVSIRLSATHHRLD
jgi:type VI secretion system protein ImpH